MKHAFEELRANLGCVRIAHHIPVRIQLQFKIHATAIAPSGEQARRLRSILDRIPTFHSVLLPAI